MKESIYAEFVSTREGRFGWHFTNNDRALCYLEAGLLRKDINKQTEIAVASLLYYFGELANKKPTEKISTKLSLLNDFLDEYGTILLDKNDFDGQYYKIFGFRQMTEDESIKFKEESKIIRETFEKIYSKEICEEKASLSQRITEYTNRPDPETKRRRENLKNIKTLGD